MKVKKAIIPAAGLGTRFLPATKAQPKEMLPIVDKPTIQYIIEEAVASGIEDIIIVTGRSKRAIEDHFDRSLELESALSKSGKDDMLEEIQGISELANIYYIRQKEAKGLGHAIACAKTFIGNEPFAVLLGDDIVYNEEIPCLKQLLDVFDEYQTSILGVQTVPMEDTSKYGIVEGKEVDDRIYKVRNLVEKPAPGTTKSNVAILGRYIITPQIFDLLETAQPGSGGEIQLTDALERLGKTQPIYAYNFKGKRYDVGDKLGFLSATVEYALRRDELKDKFTQYLKGLDL